MPGSCAVGWDGPHVARITAPLAIAWCPRPRSRCGVVGAAAVGTAAQGMVVGVRLSDRVKVEEVVGLRDEQEDHLVAGGETVLDGSGRGVGLVPDDRRAQEPPVVLHRQRRPPRHTEQILVQHIRTRPVTRLPELAGRNAPVAIGIGGVAVTKVDPHRGPRSKHPPGRGEQRTKILDVIVRTRLQPNLRFLAPRPAVSASPPPAPRSPREAPASAGRCRQPGRPPVLLSGQAEAAQTDVVEVGVEVDANVGAARLLRGQEVAGRTVCPGVGYDAAGRRSGRAAQPAHTRVIRHQTRRICPPSGRARCLGRRRFAECRITANNT